MIIKKYDIWSYDFTNFERFLLYNFTYNYIVKPNYLSIRDQSNNLFQQFLAQLQIELWADYFLCEFKQNHIFQKKNKIISLFLGTKNKHDIMWGMVNNFNHVSLRRVQKFTWFILLLTNYTFHKIVFTWICIIFTTYQIIPFLHITISPNVSLQLTTNLIFYNNQDDYFYHLAITKICTSKSWQIWNKIS